jgi:hypothetical protein
MPMIPPSYHPFPALRTTAGDLVDVSAADGRATILRSPGLEFCEDVSVWDAAGLVLASCDPGRGEWNTVMVNIPRPLRLVGRALCQVPEPAKLTPVFAWAIGSLEGSEP